ncbi:FKBP-type peptidyl-prolyl cis-trans isomerase [Campylobacter sp. MG1]|uniref:FKBP-type peptidyl-prolyl cis-trans isomerase n=1 Tax=Campylobacter sp. MG1 TaxID=2976332 RepID=UPI00226D1B85|nr:peptidylprolyl isomerase [Campylobacter sp. MG1]
MAIEKDSVVSFSFILRDAKTNEILEDNSNLPVSFLLGRGHILESLEEELAKLNIGEESDILITKDKAWQEYDENLIQELPKEQFAGIELREGLELFGENEDGSNVRVIVKEIKDSSVVIDYNHPYAGKDLLFTVLVSDVRAATEDELASGAVSQPGGCGCGHHGQEGCKGDGSCGQHEHHHHNDGCCGHEHNHGGCCGH